MKKLLCFSFALILLLTGCATQQDPETTVDTTTVSTEPVYMGLYVQNSSLEQQTQGAVRRYELPGSYEWLSQVGDKVLLASGEGSTELTVLTGTDGVPTTQVLDGIDITTPEAVWQATYTGFVYYSPEEKQAVFLDPQLQEQDRVKLPDEIQGTPVFAPDGSQIFFCVPGEIRAMEVERKLSRLIKSHSGINQELLDCYFEGQLLGCRIEEEDGKVNTLYLSTENGRTNATDNSVEALFTYENRYFVLRADGTTQQRLVGEWNATAAQLNVYGGSIWPVLQLGGAVCVNGMEDGFALDLYDLTTGQRTASVAVSGADTPTAVLGDRWSGCVWLLTNDSQSGAEVLLRWDPKLSPVTDETVYTGQIYTADAPDKAGLEACEDRVDALNRAHGITIRIWERAVKSSNGYALEKEYQTAAINQMLDSLEQVFALFPNKFLYRSVSNSIRICIVRSVNEQMQSVQYWYDGDPFIVLSVGVNVREEFIKGMSYVVDSHILGNSPLFDYWNGLNPEGFAYGDESTYSQSYMEGDSAAFFNEACMASVTEDRCQVFCQAMKEENAAAFQSPIMQQKLKLLCQAIRDAWRLEQETDSYIWEQYLTEPIAYQPQ